MPTLTYRRLLTGSTVFALMLIMLGGVLQISGQTLPVFRLDSWPTALYWLLLLGGTGIVSAAAFSARRQDRADSWRRLPVLIAPVLLLLHLLAVLFLPRIGQPALLDIVWLGLDTLLIGCLLTALMTLFVPDARREQRLGGRAMLRARRYRNLALAAIVAVWLMVLSGSTMSASTAGSLFETTLQYLHRAVAMSAAVLLGLIFWQTWRTRRQDRILTSLSATAIALLAAEAFVGAASLAINWPGVLSWLHLILALELWLVTVAIGVLAQRRPAPISVEQPAPIPAATAKTPSLLNDYISLTKPKVISLLLVTTLAAMFITDQGMPSFWLVVWTMLGGYLAAGGAGAINCAFDSDIDINMGRTSRRPVPSGRIAPQHALWFGITLCVLAFLLLAALTTLLAAVLAMVGAVYYTLIYTQWLKRSTWQNIVIGGGAGAIPPLVGWTAVTGSLNLTAILLFVIIFYWTPPHFWALALVKQKDYARAGVPMLPVVAGEQETRWQILLYSLLMVCLTLLLTPLGAMGAIYLLLAIILGVLFMRYAWNVWRDGGQAHIWGLYKYSLLYLALLFAAMVLDRALL